tara:strand:+ start:563 stop:691 length:129 start_codon:yes stop_codon:yes gene_type:complete
MVLNPCLLDVLFADAKVVGIDQVLLDTSSLPYPLICLPEFYL